MKTAFPQTDFDSVTVYRECKASFLSNSLLTSALL